jgi:hypothetical protein
MINCFQFASILPQFCFQIQRAPVQQGGPVPPRAAAAAAPRRRLRRTRPRRGRAVQVDPMKPTLTAPISERLKLKCDDVLGFLCFQFQVAPLRHGAAPRGLGQGLTLVHVRAQLEQLQDTFMI